MKYAKPFILLIVAMVAVSATAQQQRLPGTPSKEALERRAQRDREWAEIMERIEAADAEWRAQWEVIFEDTREERDEFDNEMRDFSDRFSKPATTMVETTMSIGDDGLPEDGEVWWVDTDTGFITHKAEFDADGNTDGFTQTPDGRALESLETYLPTDGEINVGYSFARDRNGRPRIGEARWSSTNGQTGTLRFNHDGVPYWGEMFQDGVRRGGFYDPDLETEDPPPRDLRVPPLTRPVTQPCEECRDVAEEHNEIVAQMSRIRSETADLAERNQFTDPGVGREAIEMRYDAIMETWSDLAEDYEDARARLRDCTDRCNRPEPENEIALPDSFVATGPDGSTRNVQPGSGDVSDVFQFMIVIGSQPAAQNIPAPQPMRISFRPYRQNQLNQLQDLVMSVVATGQSSGNVFDIFAAGMSALGGGGGGGGGRGGGGGQGGGLAGQAIQMLAPDGLVLQPLTEQAAQALPQIPQISDNLVQQLVGFCLDFAKPPPTAGTQYQVAPQSLQQQFQPFHQVMNTAQRLNEFGLLNPDSNPLGYLNFVQQWSLWSMIEEWDQAGFASNFIEHTRKAVEAAGGNWDQQALGVLQDAIPGRWQDIQRVIEVARPLVEQEFAGQR